MKFRSQTGIFHERTEINPIVGWDFTYNGAIFKLKGELYLTHRVHQLGEKNELTGYYSGIKQSQLYISKLGEDLQPVYTRKVPIPFHNIEDARVLVDEEKQLIYIFYGFFDSRREMQEIGNEMFVAVYDFNWQPISIHPVTLPHFQRRWEKNWQYFIHKGELFAVYDLEIDFVVVKFNEYWQAQRYAFYPDNPLCPYGSLHGGSMPILVDGNYYVWFRAVNYIRDSEDGCKVYTSGMYGFDGETFEPCGMSSYPIILPDLRDNNEFWGRQNSFITTMGAVFDEDKREWLVSAGHQDKCTIIERLYHDELFLCGAWLDFKKIKAQKKRFN